MDVMASPALQTVAQDRLDASRARAMEQQIGRRRRREAEVDLDAVALVGADPRAGVVEAQAALVVARDDLAQIVGGDGEAVRRAGREQLVDRDPAAGLELQADTLRLVAQMTRQ